MQYNCEQVLKMPAQKYLQEAILEIAAIVDRPLSREELNALVLQEAGIARLALIEQGRLVVRPDWSHSPPPPVFSRAEELSEA